MQEKVFRTLGIALAILSSAAFAQTAAPAPAFEVASIKATGRPDQTKLMSGQIRVGVAVEKERVDISFLSLADLIGFAYRVKPHQVSGPAWMNDERFEVHAKTPEGVSKEQIPEMLQTLLAERFKLAVHRGSKEQNIYALVVGKNGSKLKESVSDAPAATEKDGFPVGGGQMRLNSTGTGMSASGGPFGPVKTTMGPAGMHVEAEKITMAGLALMLTPLAGRPIVDMTGMKGTYQLELDIAMEDLRGGGRAAAPGSGGGGESSKTPTAASDPSSGSIFAATVQQLGLKLDPRKGPVEIIIVDHSEKLPTDN